MDSGRPDGVSPGSRHRREQGPRRRNLRPFAWIAVGVAVALLLAAGVIMSTRKGAPHAAAPDPGTSGAPSPAAAAPPSPPAVPGPSTTGAPHPPPAALADEFAQLAAKLNAKVGIAFSAVGSGQEPIQLGDWQSGGPAWSTMKVPLVIAALQDDKSHTITDTMTAAITESDNAAAEKIWAGLSDDPVKAAHRVEDVLRQNGDPTIVQSQRVRPPFTAFGQTDWPLTDQVRFTSAAFCDKANGKVFDLMGQIAKDQSWGIGTISGTRFKGGWGPSEKGDYLVRQIGVLNAADGMQVAVALAAQPNTGKFEDGTAELTEMAKWLNAHLAKLSPGRCGS